jgi:hypothetical protein
MDTTLAMPEHDQTWYVEWRTNWPWVYERFKWLPQERQRLNRKFGMQALVERVR